MVLAAGPDCMAEVIVAPPVSSCNNITSMTYTLPGGSPVTVSLPPPATINLGFHPAGIMTVTWNVADDCSPLPSTAVCTQQINIDNQPPTVICPTDITVGNNLDGRRTGPRMLTTLVDIGPPPVYSDNCTPNNKLVLKNNITNNADTTASLPLGTTQVCWTVTDLTNNSSTCCFNVTIIDNSPPVITCPANVTTSCSAPTPYVNFYTFFAAGGDARDESKLDTISFKWVKDVSSDSTCINRKTISRYYMIRDTAGNADTCFQTIVIKDDTPPSITCKDTTVYLNNLGMASLTRASLLTSSSDNCGGPITLTSNPSNLNFACNDLALPDGIVQVTITATDPCGNLATCISKVTVKDTLKPSIVCPGNISVNTATCSAVVNYTTPVGTDNCSGSATTQVSGLSSGSSFPIGVTINTFMVTASNGQTATCSFTVTVSDNVLPTISCPTNITVNAITDACNAVVNYTPPTGSDNCPSSTTTQTAGLPSGAIFPVGVTTNTFVVTASNGQTASCSFTVTVVDNQLPVISCPASITVNPSSGLCTATVNYSSPVGTDNCPGAATTQIAGLASGSIFPVGVTTNTFRVTAANGASASCSFTVTVVDNQPPVINCPAIDSVYLNDSCKLVLPDLRPKVSRNDNCGSTTITQSPLPGTVLLSSHNQTHTVTFTVTDLGGLTSVCSTTITAKDKLGPDIVCRQTRVVAISSTPSLSAESFITEARDNCGGPLIYKVRRMSETTYQNMVSLSCDDVNDTLIVVVKVCDILGNFTECMDTVLVQDKIPPVIVTPLPDVSVSCEYPLNINNLSAFGTFVPQGTTRNNIVINDPGVPKFYPTGIAGQDGVYSDNCPGAQITIKVRNLLTMCNTGEIKRDFIIKDLGGDSTVFTQTIFVTDIDKFDENDIIWPSPQVDYFYCNHAVPDTNITKSPGLITDKCNQVAATFSDQSLPHPLYCKVIRRTWTVIDWCQYKTNTLNSPGKWIFTQDITIKNTVPPVIISLACRDTIICAPYADCNAPVTFSVSGSDDCLPVVITWTYKIDIDNNGGSPDITGSGSTFTKLIGLGTHKLTWEAKDGCGNVSTCSRLFTVKDCKAPSAVAMQGLAINLNPTMAMSTMWAKDFNNFSSDNCTPADQLKFSFSPDVNDIIRTFNCDSLGRRSIEFWVTDKAGNQSRALTYVSVQDNQHACSGSGRIGISGAIYTEDKKSLPETKITIDGGETEGELMTDKRGQYSFANLAIFNNYHLAPYRNTNHVEGITTLDLVMIQRHILGMSRLDSPYKIIAADVNNSKSVTASDIIELRKMILGLQSEFSNNTSWRFVDANFTFKDKANPWPFNDKLVYENLGTNMSKSDFVAIKTGDVNGTISANLSEQTSTRTKESAHIYTQDVLLTSGQSAAIPIFAGKTEKLSGMQWTMEILPGMTFAGFEAGIVPIKDYNLAQIVKKGKTYITLSYDDPKALELKEGDLLFHLIFDVQKSANTKQLIRFGSDVTQALAFTPEGEEEGITFAFKVDQQETFYIRQNQPNPFHTETKIFVGLTKASAIDMTIFDAKGNRIYESKDNLPAGEHQLIINDKQLNNQTGIFFCKIKTGEISKVIKLLRIE
jgi:hypothetical protein